MITSKLENHSILIAHFIGIFSYVSLCLFCSKVTYSYILYTNPFLGYVHRKYLLPPAYHSSSHTVMSLVTTKF